MGWRVLADCVACGRASGRLLWANVLCETCDAVRDLAPIAGLGDAAVEIGEDARVSGYERPHTHGEQDGESQCEDAADESSAGLAGVCRAPGPSSGQGNQAQDNCHKPAE
jgi:hypothetical protein